MKKYWQLLFGQTAKNSYITVGSNVTHGLLVMLFFAIISRLLGPEKFGLVSIVFAIFAITFDVFGLGTSQALIRFVSVSLGRNDKKSAQQYASAILRLRLLESLFLIIVASIAGRLIAHQIYQTPSLSFPLSIAISAAGGLLLVDFVITLLQSLEKFLVSAWILLSIVVLRLLMTLWLIYFSQASIVLITTIFVVAPIISALMGFVVIRNHLSLARPSKIVVSKLIHFSKWMALWGITASLVGKIDVLLVGKLTSVFETGIYSAASRLAMGYIIIGGSFASVLVPKISRVISKKEELKRQFILVSKAVSFIIAGMIVIAFTSNWLIPAIFGNEYLQSIPVFRFLTFALVFFIGSIPANAILLSLGHSKWIGLLSLLQLIVLLTTGWSLIPSMGAQGAAFALGISYVLAFVLSTGYAVRKVFH